jgi:nucleotide-binding universal stress UspA family protein
MAGVVVVGVDGSESSGKAARRAAEMAAALGAALHVVTAYEGTDPEVIEVGSDVWMISSGDEANTMLDGVVAELRGIVDTITTDALEGKPADILVSEAEQMEATLIVVGNRRVQGIGRLLGSVATSVLHHAPCDVLVVKTV